jgi:protein gp37
MAFGVMTHKYQRIAAEKGEHHRVFCGSMMDIFEKSMPLLNPSKGFTETQDLRNYLFGRIDAGYYNNLIFLFLTKRPSNILKMVPVKWLDKPPANVMYGTSASDHETFYNMVKHLLKVPGKHFVSVEPQIQFIDINCLNILELGGQRVDWIIQGGESGHNRRPFDLQWAYSMRDQCKYRGIPYFFKQIDKIKPIPEDLLVRQFPGECLEAPMMGMSY